VHNQTTSISLRCVSCKLGYEPRVPPLQATQLEAELTLDVVEALRDSESLETADFQVGCPQSLLDICTAALDTVAFPICAVDTDRRLLVANRTAKSCIRQCRWLSMQDGRICVAVHESQDRRFGTAMERLRDGRGSTLFLTDTRNGGQAMMTVVPILRCAPNGSAFLRGALAEVDCLGLVWLTTGETDSRAIARMAELFLLTPAEQQLLTRLADGEGVREAAARLEVSVHTARNQLKSILGKTGCHSQARLLTLVARVASISLPDPEWMPRTGARPAGISRSLR
jgi:DNA-binding CsgD family transcriptional regulator